MPIILCPNCQERMNVSSADVGERVVCPGCEHRFVARDDAPAPRDDDDRPRERSRSRGRDDDRDYDRPRQKPKSNRLLWIVLITVGVLSLVVCGGCIGFGIYVNKAKATFESAWADHSVASFDGGSAPITASFPMPAISTGLNDSANKGTGSAFIFDNVQQQGSIKDAKFMIGFVDYPAGTENPLEKGYLPIRTAITADHMYNPLAAPRIASELPVTVGGYPGKEVKYMEEEGGYTLQVIHVDDRPKGGTVRLVVILAGGVGLKDEDKQKFLGSVKIGKGK